MKKLNQKILRTRLGLAILALAAAALVNSASRADETAAVSTNATAASLLNSEYVADIDQVIAHMQKEGIQTNTANIYSEFQKASKGGKYLIRLER